MLKFILVFESLGHIELTLSPSQNRCYSIRCVIQEKDLQTT